MLLASEQKQKSTYIKLQRNVRAERRTFFLGEVKKNIFVLSDAKDERKKFSFVDLRDKINVIIIIKVILSTKY